LVKTLNRQRKEIIVKNKKAAHKLFKPILVLPDTIELKAKRQNKLEDKWDVFYCESFYDRPGVKTGIANFMKLFPDNIKRLGKNKIGFELSGVPGKIVFNIIAAETLAQSSIGNLTIAQLFGIIGMMVGIKKSENNTTQT